MLYSIPNVIEGLKERVIPCSSDILLFLFEKMTEHCNSLNGGDDDHEGCEEEDEFEISKI